MLFRSLARIRATSGLATLVWLNKMELAFHLKFGGSVLENFGVSPVGPEVLLLSPCGKQIKQSKMLNLRGI